MTSAGDSDSSADTAGSAVEDDSKAANSAPVVDDPQASEGDQTPTPTPQSEALRRQQYYVAVGGGVLAGAALMAGFYQRFPDAPLVLPVLAGVFGAGLVLWLARKSVFPGEGELGEAQ